MTFIYFLIVHSIPSETHGMIMSQSATPATENDRRTSSDTLREARFCGFPHGHPNFCATTVARTVANTKAASSGHDSTPRPLKCETRTLRYAFRKKLFHREASRHRCVFTHRVFTQRNFYTEILAHRKLLHMGSFQTEKLLHTEASISNVLTQRSFLHRDPCTHRMATGIKQKNVGF